MATPLEDRIDALEDPRWDSPWSPGAHLAFLALGSLLAGAVMSAWVVGALVLWSSAATGDGAWAGVALAIAGASALGAYRGVGRWLETPPRGAEGR